MTGEFERGTFLMVNVAAQRARQLMQGAAPLIRSNTRKPAAIAIREVREGLVPHYLPDELPSLTEDPASDTEVETTE